MKPITRKGSALVGGATGVVTTLFVTVIAAHPDVRAGLVGISSGEWLQAGAAIIGVFLTIQGTLWLEDRKRLRERKEEARLLREALALLNAFLPSASAPVNAEWDLAKRTAMTRAHYEMIRTGLESVAYARQAYRVRSYNLWNALTGIETNYAIAREALVREERIVRGDHVTELVLAISREKIEAFAQELLAPVDAAIKALNEESV